MYHLWLKVTVLFNKVIVSLVVVAVLVVFVAILFVFCILFIYYNGHVKCLLTHARSSVNLAPIKISVHFFFTFELTEPTSCFTYFINFWIGCFTNVKLSSSPKQCFLILDIAGKVWVVFYEPICTIFTVQSYLGFWQNSVGAVAMSGPTSY